MTAYEMLCIIVLGLTGWVAHRIMHTHTGIFLNIVLVFVGSLVSAFGLYILGFEGRTLGLLERHLREFVVSIIGTCALIFILRKLGLTL